MMTANSSLYALLALTALSACGGSSDGGSAACPDGVGPKVHDRETIEADTTWKAGCGPHVVNGFLHVTKGATLTLEPGTQVRLGAEAAIEVGRESDTQTASLDARGTAEKPVSFMRDGAEPWAYLQVQYPARALFEHVVVDGGGGDLVNAGNASVVVRGDGALPRKPMATLAHVTVRNSVGPGLWVRASAALNAASTNLTITGCGKEDADGMEQFPVVVQPTALDTLPTGTYTGNAVDELLIDTEDATAGISDTVENVTIHDRGVPYRVGASAGSTFRFGTDEAHPKVTLTIEPGVTLRFPMGDETASGGGVQMTHWTSSASNEIPGTTLHAVGTAEKPIVFTSASSAPKAGDWRGIWFGLGANADNRLEHIIVEYAGADLLAGGFACPADHSNNGAIAVMGGPAQTRFLSNSTVRSSAAAGVLKGWNLEQGPDVDFTPTNTFEMIAECVQTPIRIDQGTCSESACE